MTTAPWEDEHFYCCNFLCDDRFVVYAIARAEVTGDYPCPSCDQTLTWLGIPDPSTRPAYPTSPS